MSPRLYRLYCRLTKIKRKVSRKVSHTGRVLIVFAALCVLFGLNTRQTMMYQLASLSVMLLLLAFPLALRFDIRLRVRRILPETCTAGEKLTYLLDLQNQDSATSNGLFFTEFSSTDFPTYQEFSTLREDGETRRNYFDRKFGYYRWLWLLKQKAGARFVTSSLPPLQPDEHTQAEVSFTPLRRGYVQLGGYSIYRLEPLGLMKKELFFKDGAKLLVLPKRYSVLQTEQSGMQSQLLAGTGSGGRHGSSGEFVTLREYNSGDPLKHIDWKATARTGEPVVRQFQDEHFSLSGLMLDIYPLPEERALFEEAVSVAASIITAESRGACGVGLLCAGTTCISADSSGRSGGSSLGEKQKMLEFLACVQPAESVQFSEIVDNITYNADYLGSLIVILVSLDEKRRDLLNRLRALGRPCEVVLVTADPDKSRDVIEEHALHPVRLFDIREKSKVVDLT
ncbi:DUF58 domain-containing protein [Desulfosediminicola sp.]|uniref:DUF58 domain-containing protein n=1 Tax=Desulfosediminicola sp. TaxID=2886825 RepID=UPI003AF2142E